LLDLEKRQRAEEIVTEITGPRITEMEERPGKILYHHVHALVEFLEGLWDTEKPGTLEVKMGDTMTLSVHFTGPRQIDRIEVERETASPEAEAPSK
jgi:hypothetical protein